MTLGLLMSCFSCVLLTFLVIESHAAYLYSWMSESLQAISFPVILTVQGRKVSLSVQLDFLCWLFWPFTAFSPSYKEKGQGRRSCCLGHRWLRDVNTAGCTASMGVISLLIYANLCAHMLIKSLTIIFLLNPNVKRLHYELKTEKYKILVVCTFILWYSDFRINLRTRSETLRIHKS